MNSNYLFICVFLITLSSCKPAEYTQNQITVFETLIKNKSYSIESNIAYPQVTNAMQQVLNSGILRPGNSASAISLIGNSNFLTVSRDSISSYLPYFGERRMNVGYNGSDSAIQLIGVLENYQVKRGKRQSYTISFNAKTKTESFVVIITLFPNLKSNLELIAIGRSSISYNGHVKALE